MSATNSQLVVVGERRIPYDAPTRRVTSCGGATACSPTCPQAGALTLDRRADVMKYRVQIGRRASWSDAIEFAEQRNAAPAAEA